MRHGGTSPDGTRHQPHRRPTGAGVLPTAVLTALLTSSVAGCGTEEAGTAAPTAPAGSASATATPSATPSVDTRAVVLGDSYTVGLGSAGEVGYVEALAAQMDWTVVRAGESGTGYVNPSGVDGQSVYGDRVDQVAAASPSVVLVQGSTNDVGFASAAAVGDAAQAMYGALQESLPDARIVVVGPLDAPTVDRASVTAVRDELAAAAAAAGLPFIDPIAESWLEDEELYADGLHPDDEGYLAFAADLAEELRELGF